jgi:membrane protease YdiL (CAAX protease family)
MEADPQRRSLYSFWFLLCVTVGSGILAELTYDLLRSTGARERLPALVAVVIPPVVSGLLVPYLLIRFVYRSSLRDFGVRWIDPARPFATWLVGSSALALVTWFAFWGALVALLALAARTSPDRVPLTVAGFHAKNPLHVLLHGEPTPRLTASVIHMTLLVGFIEELFGRGYLQNALDRRSTRVLGRGRFTVRTSTLLTAVLFAFWHTQWTSGSPLAILKSAALSLIVLPPSLLLCIVYEKTRSMLAVIALHDVIDAGKLVTWYVWSRILPG